MLQPTILKSIFVLFVQILYSDYVLASNNTTTLAPSSVIVTSSRSPPFNISTLTDIPSKQINSSNATSSPTEESPVSSPTSSSSSSSPLKCEWYQKKVFRNNTVICKERRECHKGFEYHPNDLSKLSETHDWNCQSCSKNSFQPYEGHHLCQTCKVTFCPHNKFLIRNCTPKWDGYCSVCKPGYFQDDKTGGCHPCKLCCNINGQPMKRETDCLNHTPGILKKQQLCMGNDSYCTPMIVLQKAKLIKTTTAKPSSIVNTEPKHWQVIFGVIVGILILFGIVMVISIGCYRWRKKYSKFFNTIDDDVHVPNQSRSKNSDHTQVNITQMGNVQYRKLIQQSSLVENSNYTGPPENMLEVEPEDDVRDVLKIKLKESSKLEDFSEDGLLLH